MKFPPLAYAFKATLNDYVHNDDHIIDRQVRAAQVARFMHTIMLYAEENGIQNQHFANVLHGILTPQSQSTWAQQVVDNEDFQKIYQEYRENSTLTSSNIDIHDYANYRYSDNNFNYSQFEHHDENSIREWLAEINQKTDSDYWGDYAQFFTIDEEYDAVSNAWDGYLEATSMIRLVDAVVVPEMDNITVANDGIDHYPYFNNSQVAEFIDDMSQRGYVEMFGHDSRSALIHPKDVFDLGDEGLKYGVLGWRPESQVAINPSLVADGERLTASGEILRNGVKIFAYAEKDKVLYGVSSLRGKLSGDNLSLAEARKHDVATFIDYHEKMRVNDVYFDFNMRPQRYCEVIINARDYELEISTTLDRVIFDFQEQQERESSHELGAFDDFARIDTAEMQAEAPTAITTPSREQKMAQGMSLVEVAGVSEAAAAAPEHEPAVSPLQDPHTPIQDAEAIPPAAVDEVEM